MTGKAFLNRRRRYLHQRRSSNSAPSGEDATSSMQVEGVSEQSENMPVSSMPVSSMPVSSMPVSSMPLSSIPLSSMLTGQIGTIQDLRGGRGLVGRLASLGFTPGAYVEMLQNFRHGPLIVEIRDVRIALGRGEARKIRVTLNAESERAVKPTSEE